MDRLGPVRPSKLREHLVGLLFYSVEKGPENIVQVLANEVRTGYIKHLKCSSSSPRTKIKKDVKSAPATRTPSYIKHLNFVSTIRG